MELVLALMVTLSKLLGKTLYKSDCGFSLKNEDISDGRIQDTSGEVIYKVKFTALIFRPFRGEVLDGIVYEVSNNGIMIESGPLRSFISCLVTFFKKLN